MHELVSKTIDKVSFKINIPILISIIVWLGVVINGYFNLTTNMTLLQIGQNMILEKLSSNDLEHKLYNDNINELKQEIAVMKAKLEKIQ